MMMMMMTMMLDSSYSSPVKELPGLQDCKEIWKRGRNDTKNTLPQWRLNTLSEILVIFNV
jgi:hypothetical protein